MSDIYGFKDKAGNVYEGFNAAARAKLENAEASAELNRQASMNAYPGRNLATVFASEIGSTDPITWLKQRAVAKKTDGIRIGDYLPCALNNGKSTVLNYQVGSIDQYYNVGDTANGHHITLVPSEVYPEYIPFNTANANNGTADETNPWRASNLFRWCNETFYGYLPTAWKNALKDIRVYNPIRYSASGTLTDDNSGKWMNLGKVWVPSEIEVWGSVRLGTPHNVPVLIACTDRQLPIFEGGRTVVRSRSYWWERCPAAGSSTYVCYVSYSGHSNATLATSEWVRPLPCFHIG